jgi:hypothetical protein
LLPESGVRHTRFARIKASLLSFPIATACSRLRLAAVLCTATRLPTNQNLKQVITNTLAESSPTSVSVFYYHHGWLIHDSSGSTCKLWGQLTPQISRKTPSICRYLLIGASYLSKLTPFFFRWFRHVFTVVHITADGISW